MSLRQAAQQALEALTLSIPKPRPADDDYAELGWKEHNAAITALRAALAEPEQEPVAWMESPHGVIRANPLYRIKAPQSVAWSIPLYAHPPIPRKPLTDEEISAILDDTLEGGSFFDVALAVARAIERAHGIGAKE